MPLSFDTMAAIVTDAWTQNASRAGWEAPARLALVENPGEKLSSQDRRDGPNLLRPNHGAIARRPVHAADAHQATRLQAQHLVQDWITRNRRDQIARPVGLARRARERLADLRNGC